MEIKRWDSIDEERLNENITRKMFWGDNIMVTKWTLKPDTALPVHDHVSEQITMVEQGTVTLQFPEGDDVTLGPGEMLVIPSLVPHGVQIGPDGALVTDLFSPIREDFITKTATYLAGGGASEKEKEDTTEPELSEDEKYTKFQSYLATGDIKIPLDKLKEVPLEILARYVYDRECITMGQLRAIMGLDKKQAKQLLREWKHGDDHSESSLQKAMQRRVILPWEIPDKKPE